MRIKGINQVIAMVICAMVVFSCGKNKKGLSQEEVEIFKESLDDEVGESQVLEEIQQVDVVSEEKESAWQNEINRQELIASIKVSYQEGLNASDYYYKDILKLEERYSQLSEQEKQEYYSLLSESFKKYFSHLFYGKVNYKSLNKDWDIDRKAVDVDRVLQRAIDSTEVRKSLRGAIPQHTHYQELKKALAYFQARIGKDGKDIEINDNIYLMSEHPEMINIKKKLKLWDDSERIDTVKAEYNQAIMPAIKRFQDKHCIEANGIINYETVKALNVSMKTRMEQVMANLERWRWFPRSFGREYLLINIPEYQLYYYKDGKVIRKHKIVVGKEDRQTPVMTSKIAYIVLNPTWTVPETILKEDYLPEMIKDNNYLKNKGINIYKDNGSDVKTLVDPKDWNADKPLAYKYIQQPSKDNVLGEVKFIFANNHFVYLHDTNQRWYFEKVNRDLSSGCIRLENAIELGMDLSTGLMNYLAKNDLDEVERVSMNFDTDARTNIVILYYTAWGTNDGVKFRPDVYNLDSKVYKFLSQ